MRVFRKIIPALLIAGVAACAGTPDSRTEEADLALRRGNPERAYSLYQAAQAERPDDPLLAQKVEVARKEAAEMHLGRARELSEAGRFAEAKEEVRLARRWAPDDPRVDEREAEVARRRAETTTGVGDAIERAEAELSSGRAGAALATLESARVRYGAAPELVRAETSTRSRVETRLAAKGRAALDAGRAALATLWLRAAAQVSGSPPETLARAESGFAGELRATAAVAGVSDGTGGRASPTAFEARLLAEIRDHLPAPAWEVARGASGELTLSVTIDRVDVGDDAPRTKRDRVEYVLRIEQRENVERNRLKDRERALATRLDQAESIHEAAAGELESLEKLRGSATVTARGGRRFGPYAEAAYYRYLTDARTREANAKNAVDRIEAELEAVRRRAAAEPVWNEVPIKAQATTDVTTHRRTAVAEATVVFGDGARGPARAEVSATDVSHDAIPSAGIPADPPTLPGESELARKALDALAERIAETAAAKAADLRKGLLAEGDRLAAAGDRDGALDRYAAFLLSAGEARPIERGRAAGEVESRTGIRIVGTGMDLSNLRID